MRYIDADKLAEYEEHAWDWDTVNGIETETALRQVISDIRHEPTAKVREDSWAMGKDNRYLDLTKLYEYFRSKEITELKFYDNDIVHEFKMVVRGEWIKHIDNQYPQESTEECSVCHHYQFLSVMLDNNYCPNCGARMGDKK